ncbi:MAG: DNA polymerase III subunit gamma/tau [Bacteroidetes bacterium]|nr:DNA polymerase III subunit gamma/tau [Bacteroidota bacterium]
MDNFIVSARKYRPATFHTVVGQMHITSTLQNAIKNKHLAQAFLFCGPRGVGKTTCARILAKTINCFKPTAATEACDQCESCVSFNNGQSMNVHELDAASNNSVDDIRSLVDQVRFAPQLGQYKVYIIDEVHMLSTAAFNAFLKTLEEPPAHAIFILATTEKHKIIPTILSRCQIFDFNRIQIDDIAKHLAFIAQSENISAEMDGLHIIAQKADGALRDALSMFDQIVSFAGNSITYKAVIDNLNILDYDYYFKVTDFILEENISECLLLFNEVLNNGFDGHNFINGLAEHYRNLLVSQDNTTLQLLEVGNNIREKYKEQSKKCSLHFLINGLNTLNTADYKYKVSKNQRLLVELSLMQMCTVQLLKNSQVAEKKNDSIEQSSVPKLASPAISPLPINASSVSEPKPENLAIPAQNIEVKPKQAPAIPSFSINSFTKAKPEEASKTGSETVVSVKSESPKAEFTQEQLELSWKKFADKMNALGKLNFYSTLTSHKPQKKDNFQLEFTLDNKVQEEEVNREKLELLGHLRRELNNMEIQLSTTINKNESEKRPYTNVEKFKHMLAINPAIETLRKQLDLEV